MGFQSEAVKIIDREKLIFLVTIREVEVILAEHKRCEKRIAELKAFTTNIHDNFRSSAVTSRVQEILYSIELFIMRVEKQTHKLEGALGADYHQYVEMVNTVEDMVAKREAQSFQSLESLRQRLLLFLKKDYFDGDKFFESRVVKHSYGIGDSKTFTPIVEITKMIESIHTTLQGVYLLLHVEAESWVIEKQNLANAYLKKNTQRYIGRIKAQLDRAFRDKSVSHKTIVVLNKDRSRDYEEERHYSQAIEGVGLAGESNAGRGYLNNVPSVQLKRTVLTYSVKVEEGIREWLITIQYLCTKGKFSVGIENSTIPGGIELEPEEGIDKLYENIKIEIAASEFSLDDFVRTKFGIHTK